MSNNIRWQEHPACGKSHLGGGIRNITPFLFPTLFQFDLVRPNLCFDPENLLVSCRCEEAGIGLDDRDGNPMRRS